MTSHVRKAKCVCSGNMKRNLLLQYKKNRYEAVFGTTRKPSKWFNLFSLADCIYNTKSPGKRPDTKRKVAEAPATFISRPRKLTRQAACK